MTFLFNDMEGTAGLSDGALSKLQCHILRSTHCIRSTQVFHRFKTRAAFAQWLGALGPVSNAQDNQDIDGAIKTVLFTHAGLSLLGAEEARLAKMDAAFRRGARHQRTISKLVDSAPTNWEGAHKAPWHAVVLYAHNGGFNEGSIPGGSADHEVHIEPGSAFDKDGAALNDPDATRYSHFGIADVGRRDPVYTEEEYKRLYDAPADHVWKWEPRHSLSTLVVADPLSDRPGSFGSYFVYRKYRQDVGEFVRRLGEIAETIATRILEAGPPRTTNRLSPKDRGYVLLQNFGKSDCDALRAAVAGGASLQAVLEIPLAAALVEFIFGVAPNGATTAHGSSPDFNYDDDTRGRTCPFNSHARKTNPRGRTGDVALERRVTIARRSSSYKRGNETGLLFWCAQASIGDQFEYIQEKWANAQNQNPDHAPTPGFDTTIGQLTPALRKTYDGWMDSTEVHVSMWEAIQHLGSEYLYAPSLDGLTYLTELGGAP